MWKYTQLWVNQTLNVSCTNPCKVPPWLRVFLTWIGKSRPADVPANSFNNTGWSLSYFFFILFFVNIIYNWIVCLFSSVCKIAAIALSQCCCCRAIWLFICITSPSTHLIAISHCPPSSLFRVHSILYLLNLFILWQYLKRAEKTFPTRKCCISGNKKHNVLSL